MTSSVATTFECQGHTLVGVFEEADTSARRAVVMIVGGPQYRVGSHRQFVLLARDLAAAGIPTLRFDHRGTGDSEGETTFEQLDPDIAAAVDAAFARYPKLNDVVLWGLCDAASAILMYAPRDSRVSGVVLLNPWVRSEQTLARSYLSSYYLKRFAQGDFWRRLLSGKINVFRSLGELAQNVVTARSGAHSPDNDQSVEPKASTPPPPAFQDRMMAGLKAFAGPALLILSGNDLTASEFRIYVESNRSYRRLLKSERMVVKDFVEADHTFSTAAWRQQVTDWTLHWLRGR